MAGLPERSYGTPRARPTHSVRDTRGTIRPAQRTAPLNIEKPDARVQLTRWSFGRLLGTAFGTGPSVALGAALYPSSLGLGTVESPRYWNDIPEGIARIEARNDHDATVTLGRGRSSYRPYSVSHPSIGWGQPRDTLPQTIPEPGQRARVVPGWIGDPMEDDWEPREEDWAPWPIRLPARPAPVRPGTSPDEGPSDHPATRPQRAPRPLALPGFPSNAPAREDDPHKLPVTPLANNLIVTVQDTLDGPRIRFRLSARREQSLSTPRYRDSKFGRRLVGYLNAAITRTYGVVSEAQDAVEVFTMNLYGVDERGRVRSAMEMEGWSSIDAVRGYLEGDYKLDTVGFVFDYAVNQAEDFAYAKTAQAQMSLATAVAGDTGYKALRNLNRGLQMQGSEDVRTQWIRPASEWVSSWDAQRGSRVRGLWSS